MKTHTLKIRLPLLAAEVLLLLVCLIILGIPTLVLAQMTYLGTINGKTSYARDVNNSGQVVGQSTNWEYAFLWENGVMTDLGNLGGNMAYALAINDHGQIVGTSKIDGSTHHAFLWENGTMTDLGIEGDPWDINNQGQIALEGRTPSGDLHTFIWENGVMTDLGPTFSPFINEDGQVVGGETIITATGFFSRLLVWQDGVVTELGTTEEGVEFWPYRMNNNGQIIGRRGKFALGSLLWEDGVTIDLGGPDSIAYDINDVGQVVRNKYSHEPYSANAVLWDCGETIYLQTVGVGSLATAINDHGQVVGFTWLPSGEGSAFIMNYVSEPSIRIDTPNGGEDFPAGTTYEIIWTSCGVIEYVNIEYSTNNGAEWIEIVSTTENSGSYSWEIPCDLSDVCLVRISDVDSELSDTSDEVFSIIDDEAPYVAAIVEKNHLWPPNRKMVDVDLTFEVSDICDPEPGVSIEVTSDEPTATATGAGASRHAPDAEITDDGRILVRAERSGKGDGRVYQITVTVIDESGNSASFSAPVKVNSSKNKEAVDSGQNYDATLVN